MNEYLHGEYLEATAKVLGLKEKRRAGKVAARARHCFSGRITYVDEAYQKGKLKKLGTLFE